MDMSIIDWIVSWFREDPFEKAYKERKNSLKATDSIEEITKKIYGNDFGSPFVNYEGFMDGCEVVEGYFGKKILLKIIKEDVLPVREWTPGHNSVLGTYMGLMAEMMKDSEEEGCFDFGRFNNVWGEMHRRCFGLSANEASLVYAWKLIEQEDDFIDFLCDKTKDLRDKKADCGIYDDRFGGMTLIEETVLTSSYDLVAGLIKSSQKIYDQFGYGAVKKNIEIVNGISQHLNYGDGLYYLQLENLVKELPNVAEDVEGDVGFYEQISKIARDDSGSKGVVTYYLMKFGGKIKGRLNPGSIGKIKQRVGTAPLGDNLEIINGYIESVKAIVKQEYSI